MTHCIRLRGPWEFERLGDVAAEAGEMRGRVALPDGWMSLGNPELASRVRLIRRFGRPTGITASERIELVIAGPPPTLEVALNGSELNGSLSDLAMASSIPTDSPSADWRADVTELLEARNELRIVVDRAFAEARLEIVARST